MIVDLLQLEMTRRQEYLREAECARLAAQLPRRLWRVRVRRAIALTCHRLANWLDNSDRYARPVQSGLADWAAQPSKTYIWLTDSVTSPAARDYKTRPTDQLILR